jgi:predicted DNA-binding protein with PD1-like motif
MADGTLKLGLAFIVVCRLDPGQDLLQGIRQAAEKHKVKSGSFSAIGVLSPARVGYLNKATMSYTAIEFSEHVELVSCTGLITQKDDGTEVHAHLVVADKDGNAHGGHALDGCRVDVTCELVIYAFDKAVSRRSIPGTTRHILDV